MARNHLQLLVGVSRHVLNLSEQLIDDHTRRNQHRTLLDHHRGGLLVEVRAVFDGVDAGLERCLDAG